MAYAGLQPLHFEAAHHPEIGGDGERDAEDRSGRGDEQILRLEITHDGLPACAERAANPDLAASLRHPVAGEPHDAEAGDQEERHAHGAQDYRQSVIVLVGVNPGNAERLHFHENPVAVQGG